MQQQQQRRTVYFTGVPLFMEGNKLRQHFESVGHVIDFRMFDPLPGKDIKSGLVEYMDDRSASEAIVRLNGTTFGERSIKVMNAAARSGGNVYTRGKRQRPWQTGPLLDEEGRELMTFSKKFYDPVLGRENSIILDSLRQMATEDAYEAVEQLRVLTLERRQDAKALLTENPALRSAVVMILQHAGRLPSGTFLPAEAFQASGSSKAEAADDLAGVPTPAPPVASSSADGDSRTTRTTEAQRDEVLQLISNMSEEDVERVLSMTDAGLAQIADPAQRCQLKVLRDRLLEMSSDL